MQDEDEAEAEEQDQNENEEEEQDQNENEEEEKDQNKNEEEEKDPNENEEQEGEQEDEQERCEEWRQMHGIKRSREDFESESSLSHSTRPRKIIRTESRDIAQEIEKAAAARATKRNRCPECGGLDTDIVPKGSRKGEWVECSSCLQWWHAVCEDVEEEEWKRIEGEEQDFVCRHCRTTASPVHASYSPYTAPSPCLPPSSAPLSYVTAVSSPPCAAGDEMEEDIRSTRNKKKIVIEEDDD